MSKIISVNAGSSSLKFQLFEMPSEEVLTSGIVEKIGFEDAIFTIKVNGEKIKKVLPIPDHTKAVSMLLEALVEYKIVNSLDEITGAGHRAVHGGEIFKESVPVTEDVVEKFASLNDLAPLHNPAGLVGYNAFKNNLPNCKHVFVFDTAFHSTMPKESYIYALPMKYYDEYKIRRYGFHGTSHKYVSLRCAELMNKKVEDTKIITCHLGNGASITAVDGGKSINTSMGFTPLAGVMMGTRCGDIDPAIVTYIMKKTGATPDEMDDIMVKQFQEMFDKINAQLNDVFRALFGGGKARLFMVDPEDVLNTGIDIDVQPPGKTVQNIRLFSGGEKSLIAICVLFSILKARTMPLCIFDEVEAALDQANVERFAKYIAQFRGESQFIVVTHRPGTMAQCDALYGVTMQQNGVSQLLKVKLQDAINMIDKEEVKA